MKTQIINPVNICNLVLFTEGKTPVLNEEKGLTFRGMVEIISAVTGKEFSGKEPIPEIQKWGKAALQTLVIFEEMQNFVLFPKGILDGTVNCEVSQQEFVWFT